MATLTNTYLAGAPLIYQIQANSYTGATFHRILLTVSVIDSNDNATLFSFSKPVTNGQHVSFDVSSAVQAVIDNHQPAADSLIYLSYSVAVTAVEEYMIDGEVHSIPVDTSTHTPYIYAGRYTDAERLGFVALPTVWSRKPTSSPEICFVGCPHIVPGQRAPQVDGDPWVAPSATVATVAAGLSGSVYGITKPDDGHELRFINSLGIHENVFVSGLPVKQVPITTEQYTIACQETFSQFSRGLAVKRDDHEVWTLSSGPLDEAWASYFIHEVLMARWAWIEIGGHYVPCHILPEETTTLVNREEASLLEVTFKVQLDIDGSPL